MDGRHKDILRVNRSKLTREIPRGAFKDVVEDIYCRGTISLNMKDDILCERTQREQICLFLDILRTRDAEAFDEFYNALVDCDMGTAADLLKPELANTRQQRHRHDVQESCPFNPLQQVQNVTLDDDLSYIKEWPLKERCTEDYPDRIELNLCNSDICSEMNDKYQRSCLKSDGQIYKMSAKKRGYVLVINNKNFDNKEKDRTRYGTEVDAKAIEVLFTKLNFTVDIRPDLSYQKMEEVLQEFGKMDHSKFDCFICFILSHGMEESITCVDERQLQLQNIFNYFNGDNCPSLVEKPKIFFIQACKVGDNRKEQTDAVNAVQHKDVDFFKCFSTTLGEVSYRYEHYGSRFIYTWIYTIEKWAYKCNLMELQRRMNNLMQRFESVTQTQQTGETRTTSGKEFYFFPGLHVDEPASMTATVQDPPGPQMNPPDTQLAAPGNGQRHIGGATYQASDDNELIRGHVKTTELDTQLANQPEVRASTQEEKAVVTSGGSTTEDLAASSNINQSVASSSAATSGAENNMSASINITRQVDP